MQPSRCALGHNDARRKAAAARKKLQRVFANVRRRLVSAYRLAGFNAVARLLNELMQEAVRRPSANSTSSNNTSSNNTSSDSSDPPNGGDPPNRGGPPSDDP